MENNSLGKLGLCLAGLGALFFSACETSGGAYGRTDGGQVLAGGPHYAPGDRLYRNNHLDEIHARDITPEESRQRERAAFRGIEGARLAHRLYRGSHAEELDGACESKIAVGQGEDLWDIAELCDISLFVLADHNPALDNPRHVFEGQELNIPHTNSLNPIGLFNADYDDGVNSIPLSPLTRPPSIYHVEGGDTLSGIASRHNVSAAAIANLNPDIDWRALPVGAALKLPAARIRNDASLRPSKKPAAVRATILEVSKLTVRPGGKLRLAARGLPAGRAVGVYRGPNRRSMELVGEFMTNDRGELYADATVKKSADLGGVIFAAAVDGGDYLYSPRVRVEKLRNASAKKK